MLKLTFEDAYPKIKKLLDGKRHTLHLKAVPYLGWEDFCQDVLLHIYKKWSLYDQNRKLEPWLNAVIGSKFKNFLRDHYYRHQAPCARCPLHHMEECFYTDSGVPDTSCCFFRRWVEKNKNGYDIKLPLPISNHEQEVHAMEDGQMDYTKAKTQFEKKFFPILTPFESKVYVLLYQKNMSEIEASKVLGFKPEKARKDGSKLVRIAKVAIIGKAKEMLHEGNEDLDLGYDL